MSAPDTTDCPIYVNRPLAYRTRSSDNRTPRLILHGRGIVHMYACLIVARDNATGKVQGFEVGNLIIYDINFTSQIRSSNAVFTYGKDRLKTKLLIVSIELILLRWIFSVMSGNQTEKQ